MCGAEFCACASAPVIPRPIPIRLQPLLPVAAIDVTVDATSGSRPINADAPQGPFVDATKRATTQQLSGSVTGCPPPIHVRESECAQTLFVRNLLILDALPVSRDAPTASVTVGGALSAPLIFYLSAAERGDLRPSDQHSPPSPTPFCERCGTPGSPAARTSPGRPPSPGSGRGKRSAPGSAPA